VQSTCVVYLTSQNDKGLVLSIGLVSVGRLLARTLAEGLASLSLPDTTITTAVSVAAGPYTAPDGTRLSEPARILPVAGSIRPTADSNIQFEVWMPGSGWNGKFAGADTAVLAGPSITGRSAMRSVIPMRPRPPTRATRRVRWARWMRVWALGHPEKVVDYGYRAIHLTAQTGQAIVAAFYGQGPNHSYFSGLLEWRTAGADGGPALTRPTTMELSPARPRTS